ncbi:uncharacterized protein (UPF0262 family) [Rhodoligotrophos appendicifer]|uniref:UPF0262 family protein n=1 Tax=Rhodoligotrophos appendicifer TaxID=987056 RepID=UPI0011862E43|nr:UPF0262 family protein [Rhodoligotrophos appendicifer]
MGERENGQDGTPSPEGKGGAPTNRLIEVGLDEASLGSASRDIEHERRVAIYDLLQQNEFELVGASRGPYRLTLSVAEGRLVFEITDEGRQPCAIFGLSMSPLRRMVKDYFLVCESYYQAIRTASPSQIEAIDMGRRGLHNEGSTLLQERLKGKVAVDFDTARRLFTLICVLHWRG